MVTEIKKIVKNYYGGSAILWSYKVSHSIFEIRFTKKDKTDDLHLICEACNYIKGPVSWNNMVLEIKENNGNDLNKYMLLDKKVDFKITCDLIRYEFKKNPYR